MPDSTLTEYSTLSINPSIGISIFDQVNASIGDTSIGTRTDYSTLINAKGVKCHSVTTESLTIKSSSGNNNARLVTGSIVVELPSSGIYTFSAPNISQDFPAYVCNGDLNADSSRILSTSINATAQSITITYDNLGNTNTRLNYFYWEAVA